MILTDPPVFPHSVAGNGTFKPLDYPVVPADDDGKSEKLELLRPRAKQLCRETRAEILFAGATAVAHLLCTNSIVAEARQRIRDADVERARIAG